MRRHTYPYPADSPRTTPTGATIGYRLGNGYGYGYEWIKRSLPPPVCWWMSVQQAGGTGARRHQRDCEYS
eukprot:scaffold287609_cov26-Prasinocladus_malaysianus.AAC.1